jgi:hypothetical protein
MSDSALARFRAAVLADPRIQAELAALENAEAFLPVALARAQGFGIPLDSEALRCALRPDPLGLSRFGASPPTGTRPHAAWLPISVADQSGMPVVDWAYFGARRLVEPLFEDSIRQTLRLPLNCLTRHRTPLADLSACAGARPSLGPDGFIFHMSRCGSTLVSRMLASDPANVVISEANVVDTVVGSRRRSLPESEAWHATLLAAVVRALASKRTDEQSRCFVKLDSWHALSLPLFRRAFPDVPWIFLYREPGEVLASQIAQRGIQTMPEYLEPALFGLSDEDTQPADDYCARVLNSTCEAVLHNYALGGGILVNYRELPNAVGTRILPHFGMTSDEQQLADMMRAATFDAKTPAMLFSAQDDSVRKRGSDRVREAARRYVGQTYDRLETLTCREEAQGVGHG